MIRLSKNLLHKININNYKSKNLFQIIAENLPKKSLPKSEHDLQIATHEIKLAFVSGSLRLNEKPFEFSSSNYNSSSWLHFYPGIDDQEVKVSDTREAKKKGLLQRKKGDKEGLKKYEKFKPSLDDFKVGDRIDYFLRFGFYCTKTLKSC